MVQRDDGPFVSRLTAWPGVMDEPAKEELETAHCWEIDDRVPARPEMTAFRRTTRLHHAHWREAHGHPIGTQPIVPRPGGPWRPVGSRLPLPYARQTGATFVTWAALSAATRRASYVEPHQSSDHQRTWADLLSSSALAYNLFGDLAADAELADRAVHTWWPDVPGQVRELRFSYSPGRFDASYLNSLREFAVAILLDLDDGRSGIVAVNVIYHERNKREVPKPQNRRRNQEVLDRSGAFGPAALDVFGGSDLTVVFLEHLLLLSMLQHPSREWGWGRFVVVHPAGNVDAADLGRRYGNLLIDSSIFTVTTIEDLLDAETLPPASTTAIRERYVPSPRRPPTD